MQENAIFSVDSGSKTLRVHLTMIRAASSSMKMSTVWRMGDLTLSIFTGNGNHTIVTLLRLILWCSWTQWGTNLGHWLVTLFFATRCSRWFASSLRWPPYLLLMLLIICFLVVFLISTYCNRMLLSVVLSKRDHT